MSEKALCIQKIYEPEPGRLEIRGKILQEDLGIYAIRIVNKDDPKKDIRGIGPEFIEYNRQSKEWIANFDIEYVIEDSRKALEFYTRITPDSIPYKKKQTKNEKISYKHLQLKLRTPYMIYPDPKYAAEEEQERIRKEQEQLAYEEEERKIKEE